MIARTNSADPFWGAPRIRGELLKLGAQRFGFAMLADMALQLLKDSGVANRYPQVRQQPFADPAAGGMAEQYLGSLSAVSGLPKSPVV